MPWDSSNKSASITLTNSDTVATYDGGASYYPTVKGTIGKASGKWYWEVEYDVKTTEIFVGILLTGASNQSYIGSGADGYGYWSTNGRKMHSAASAVYGDSFAAGDIIQIALDLDNGNLFFGKNGTWQASGDPAAGTNPAYTGISGTWYPAVSMWAAGESVIANFGLSEFAYTVPSGFISFEYNPPTALDPTKSFQFFVGNSTNIEIPLVSFTCEDIYEAKASSRIIVPYEYATVFVNSFSKVGLEVYYADGDDLILISSGVGDFETPLFLKIYHYGELISFTYFENTKITKTPTEYILEISGTKTSETVGAARYTAPDKPSVMTTSDGIFEFTFPVIYPDVVPNQLFTVGDDYIYVKSIRINADALGVQMVVTEKES
jgi:hypothetical protein